MTIIDRTLMYYEILTLMALFEYIIAANNGHETSVLAQ